MSDSDEVIITTMSGVPPIEPADLARIGKYEVRGKIGHGATATVYLGYDPFAQQEVAIKLFAKETLQDSTYGRVFRHLLMNEASLAGKLAHPHIAQIYDAVVDEEQGYIVMEYVPGGTFEQFCAPESLLPVERVVELIFKCTRALDYAYHLGITHRDIKPANILLGKEGLASSDIKLTDFGAALMTASEHTQVSGVGSPAYMSPEQVREMPLTHHTDIYSLGVVMYQLLAGRLPFTASNSYSMARQIISVMPPAPSTFRRDIPVNLDDIVARAMQKKVEDRYADWGEFAHDLAHAFHNTQLKAKTTSIADSEKFETLRGLRFFEEFSDVELWEIVRFSDWDRVGPETRIMKDGEHGDSFCLLADGEVKVMKRNHVLGVLSAGECFGEMAIISKSTHVRGADIVALTDAKIITIRGEALRRASEVCRMHFYQAFLEVITNRLTMANARLASL